MWIWFHLVIFHACAFGSGWPGQSRDSGASFTEKNRRKRMTKASAEVPSELTYPAAEITSESKAGCSVPENGSSPQLYNHAGYILQEMETGFMKQFCRCSCVVSRPLCIWFINWELFVHRCHAYGRFLSIFNTFMYRYSHLYS